MLLLSMCSIGSLFLGSPRAVAHGISIFERLNKAILASVRDIRTRFPSFFLVNFETNYDSGTKTFLKARTVGRHYKRQLLAKRLVFFSGYVLISFLFRRLTISVY